MPMTPKKSNAKLSYCNSSCKPCKEHTLQLGGDMVGRDKIGRDQYNIQGNMYYGEPTDDPTEALRIYREVVLNESNRLGLDGLDVSAADPTNSARPLRLAAVYVTLSTTSQQTIAHGARRRQRREPPHHRFGGVWERATKLVLTGDPGGGKSTFVNHLAHALCGHQLGRAGDWHAQLTPEYNSLRPAQLTLLPLKLILRDFAAMLPTIPAEVAEYKRRTTPLNALTQFVAAQLQRQNLGFVEKPLLAELQAGRVWLLLDGLDEVTNPSQRQLVRDAVLAFAQRYPACHYTVTCRILAYEDKSYQLGGFAKYELAEFDDEQRQRFVQGWYAELVARERLERGKAEILASRLAPKHCPTSRFAPLSGQPPPADHYGFGEHAQNSLA
ncbi:MAG: NACHT domain-containing protein [Chloroflexi bacterium]|nr:NACHT domain-containing protein [Chloroflexota bacterium]